MTAPYVSSDFALVSFALTDPRVHLVKAEPVSPSRIRFVLEPAPVCEALAALFISGRATVEPRTYHDKCRGLKALIHAIRRGETI